MKAILPLKDRKDYPLEQTLITEMINLTKAFKIESKYTSCASIVKNAKDKLSDSHYKVFMELFNQELRASVKAILITRKIYSLKDYNTRFGYINKYLKSPKKTISALVYLDNLMSSDNVDDSSGYHQDWAIGYVRYSLIESRKEKSNAI